MGKGDIRSRRGKIYRGTRGNTRPKPSKVRKKRRAAKQQLAQGGGGGGGGGGPEA